jgi:hypothetical protein
LDAFEELERREIRLRAWQRWARYCEMECVCLMGPIAGFEVILMFCAPSRYWWARSCSQIWCSRIS